MSASTLGAYDVKDYGATGNGTTNDQPAIQSAINDAQSAGGGTIFFPPGTYQIDAGLTVSGSNIHFWGLGYLQTTLQTGFASGDAITLAGPSGISWHENFSIRGLRIGAKAVHTQGACLRMTKVINVTVADCRFNSFHKFAELGSSSVANDVQQIYIEGCRIDQASADHCINLLSGAICVIRDCFFNGNATETADRSLISQSNTNNNWDGLVVEGCTVENWPRFILVTGHGIVNARVIGNLVEPDLTRGAIVLFPTSDCAKWTIASNTFTCEGADSFGIRLDHGDGGQTYAVAITGNVISYAGDRGIDVRGDSRDISVVGNVLRGCGATGRPALTIDGGSAISVTGNTIDPAGTNMQFGIEWAGASTPSRSQAGNGIIPGTLGTVAGSP
ncbi:glycosyl hydrolase family 28-related protein [Rhodospirillum sp. A1_3_36]|uniref:glycosyl hydrolase family 28-related protein n=1 Tax=Rhodospirillum sp. A1_3_36 TaxID=3391666 RepID=UPI0039A737B7